MTASVCVCMMRDCTFSVPVFIRVSWCVRLSVCLCACVCVLSGTARFYFIILSVPALFAYACRHERVSQCVHEYTSYVIVVLLNAAFVVICSDYMLKLRTTGYIVMLGFKY